MNTAKTILITGAGTGIGRDSALALARRGHRVFATTQTHAQAQELRAHAQAEGVPLDGFKLDITDAQDRAQAAALELDVLINNAGIGESGSLAEVDLARVRHVFEVNVLATLALTQEVLRGMLARERGTVLLVSSIAGRVPMPFLMPYSMTKFALSAAGAGLRAEIDLLRKNVHVALIEPGAFHTGFNQRMSLRKYDWMGPDSYFAAHAQALRAKEAREFRLVEARSTDAIVRKIVQASEARRPRLRYTAPWWQGLAVRLARIFGA